MKRIRPNALFVAPFLLLLGGLTLAGWISSQVLGPNSWAIPVVAGESVIAQPFTAFAQSVLTGKVGTATSVLLRTDSNGGSLDNLPVTLHYDPTRVRVSLNTAAQTACLAYSTLQHDTTAGTLSFHCTAPSGGKQVVTIAEVQVTPLVAGAHALALTGRVSDYAILTAP
jgi:hypothetical protein